MSTLLETMTCIHCGESKPANEMVRQKGMPRARCLACQRAINAKRAAAVKNGDYDPISIDPCRICGTLQRNHWTCAQCTSRGHLMGRGTVYPNLCGWCEAERLKKEGQL
jgi:hypothetical protein